MAKLDNKSLKKNGFYEADSGGYFFNENKGCRRSIKSRKVKKGL